MSPARPAPNGPAKRSESISARRGLTVPIPEVPLAELPRAIKRAEELGYSEAWSYENSILDAFTPLAVTAQGTSSMRLGTAIVPVFTRPAALIAMQAVAVAETAPGRFVLGLGSSTEAIVSGWMGIDFGKPLSKVVEVAGIVKRLLAGEKVGAFRLGQLPPAPIPIYIAALGPKMLRAAGELGEGVCFYLTGPGIIPELLAGVGRPVDSMCRIGAMAGDDDEAVKAAARRASVAYALVPYYAALLERQGFGEEVAAIKQRWAAGDRAAAPGQVSDAMLDETWLLGSVDHMLERLADYERAGLGCPAIAPIGVGATPAERRRHVEGLIEALAPN
ncbi:MAG: LLM class flavin-dependent oxidoreductase [Chloroflexi bacterium]|nr:MAG: LLM class flavin-dependent oxidoreductase [Chloroflexota bacterium]